MADTKNAFDALKKGASWNTASRDALVKIEDKDGRAKKAKDIIGKIKDPKRKRAIESAYNETLTDIKSTVKLGKEPKREDFLNAIKKADNISKVLNDALNADSIILDPKLIGFLQESVMIAINTLDSNKPGMVGSAGKAVGSKMKSTAAGIIGGMASQLTEGVPFAQEMLSFAGAKIKGKFGGGASSAQTDLAAKLQGGDIDETAAEDAEENGGASSPVEKAKEEILGGATTGGGGDAGGGLEFTNELLINIDENLQFIRDNSETAESRRERLRDKGAEKVGGLVGKGKAEGTGLAGAAAGGGFMSDVLGDLTGSALGSFLGVKGFKGGLKSLPKAMLTKIGLLRILAALGPKFLPLLTNPYVLTAVAAGGLIWWLLGKMDVKGGQSWESMTPEEIEERIEDIQDIKKDSTKIMDALNAKRIAEDPTGYEAKVKERMEVYNAQAAYKAKGEIREGFAVGNDGKIFKIGGILNKGKENGGVATKTTPTKTKKPDPAATTNTLTREAQLEQLDKRYEELIKEQELLPATSERRKQLNEEIDALQEQYEAIPAGKKGLKIPDWLPNIKPGQPIPAFLDLGEEVIEKEEIKALAKITELAKTLIAQFGKDAKYQFGGADFAHRIQGFKGFGGNEGAGYSVVGAENAVKLMAELGVTNLNRINRMSRNMMGEAAHSPFAARGGWGGTVEGGMFQSGENAMKELTGMLEGIKTAKMKLIDIDRSGVPITMEEFNRRSQIGTQLNQAASNKVDIGGSGGGGFTNIDASTPVINNTTTNIIPPIDTDGGRGRGLGISG